MDKQEYIKSFINLKIPQLELILREEKKRKNVEPSIGFETGRFLGFLIRLIQAKRVLEIGTCLGFSTVCIADSLRETGGKLVAIEYNEKFFNETNKNIADAGLEEYVDINLGDARKLVKNLTEPFDLILQDADKALYPAMFEETVKLTRKHGIIIADDTLFSVMGLPKCLYSAQLDKYNKLVFSDKRLYSTILPIGDGITISVKLTE
jgi:caffeoyl-CoA O-methyltransferase